MTDEKRDVVLGDVQPTTEVSKEQVADSSWPRPGDEGYVTPDGTPQAARQLEENRRAAADRAAAGSTVHGAPMATPGPQVREAGEAAVARAENYSGVTDADRDKGVTEFIRKGLDSAADEVDKRRESDVKNAPVSASAQVDQRSADTSKSAVKR